jgi:hypothetical protein
VSRTSLMLVPALLHIYISVELKGNITLHIEQRGKNVSRFVDDRSNGVKMVHCCWRTLWEKQFWNSRLLCHGISLGSIILLYIYCHLSYTVDYNTFSLAVYPIYMYIFIFIYNKLLRYVRFMIQTEHLLKSFV